MAIQIRRAVREDASGVYEVHRRAIREVCCSHYSQGDIDAWAGRLVPEAHRDAIASREFFVAVEANCILGFGQLNPDTGEVEAIYVHPTALRRGIGSQLLTTLEEQARSAGLSSLHLDASLNSEAFYQHAAFESETRTTHALLPDVDIECVRMVKRLQP